MRNKSRPDGCKDEAPFKNNTFCFNWNPRSRGSDADSDIFPWQCRKISGSVGQWRRPVSRLVLSVTVIHSWKRSYGRYATSSKISTVSVTRRSLIKLQTTFAFTSVAARNEGSAGVLARNRVGAQRRVHPPPPPPPSPTRDHQCIILHRKISNHV